VRVALPQSTLDAAQVLIPGLFVVFVTWLGGRFALSGKIDVGDLVAFYGYAAFLVIPLRTAAEAVDKITRSHVGAQKMLNVLRVEREILEPESPVA
jgi:ABC-type bacteriocin/lantibiotic exporter with double-glycine peptidase domain